MAERSTGDETGELLPFTSSDDVASAVWVSISNDESRTTVLMLPAMGVQASFYQRLAAPLQAIGLGFATMELRGHGHSQIRPSRRNNFGYRHIVEHDIPAALSVLRQRWPERKVYLMGHSLGGQMAALFAASNPGDVEGIIAVAAATVYWKAYESRGIPLLMGTQSAGLIARVLGYFPGKRLGFAGLEARGVIRDWAYQSRTGNYKPHGSDVNYEHHLAAYAGKGLVISIAGDPLAPRGGVDHLASKLPKANVDRIHLRDPTLHALKRKHFDWVKAPDAIVTCLQNWLTKKG